ncbi:MAG: hypothetical protein RRA94_06690 [Bacteroidota bacterium]|nr:hypothetical protein [Bacteroidota bacterium]
MNFEEHISAFLDGALSPAEETEFLHILSVSPEKRALFHSYLGVQSAMAADARTSAVPSHLDSAVLAAAGLAAGGAAAGGAAAGGAAAGGAAAGGAAAGGAAALTAAGWWSVTRIISAVILGLSLFGAGYFLHDRIGTDSSSDTVARDALTTGDAATDTRNARAENDAAATDAARVGEELHGDAATEGSNREAVTGSGGGDEAPRIIYRNVYVTRVDTVYVADASGAAAARTVERVVDTMSIALVHTAQHQRPLQIIEAPRRDLDVRLPGRIEIELQREHLTTYPYIDYDRLGVDRNQQQFAASAAWIFDRNHAAGVTVGHKSFAMDYYSVDRDSIYLFQQQPALTFGGAFYRLSLPVWTGVTPELTMMLGGADFGPILGGRFAVALSPFDQFSIIVGANGTLLAYRYKDKLFTSHSLGLSYGLRYRF